MKKGLPSVSLCHAIDQLPSICNADFKESLKDIDRIVRENQKEASQGKGFEKAEKEIHSAFVEAERLALQGVLERYDIDVPTLMVDNQEYRQILRSEQTYTTAAGPARVERSLYRPKGGVGSICPLELQAGIVEKNWTPRAAKQALLIVAQLTPYEGARLFKELGAMQPSKSSLDRLPKKLNCRWEKKREEFELSLRESTEMPKQAVAVAVSLDGVLIPMQGNVVIQGDSRYQEASCGTFTYYDLNGEPLATRRYGCMPEQKK